jgi:hypothetical protein
LIGEDFMSPRTAAVAFVAMALVFTAPPLSTAQEKLQDVVVTNFPQIQAVNGTVAVEGVVRHATFKQVREVVVTPVEREKTTRLVDGGELVTDGFTSIVLTLNGRLQGKPLESGTVGAILIPDEESVIRAFDDDGQLQFPLEVAATVGSDGDRSFASEQKRVTIAFPRYRVRFYNTSDKTVTVSLFAYLTN